MSQIFVPRPISSWKRTEKPVRGVYSPPVRDPSLTTPRASRPAPNLRVDIGAGSTLLTVFVAVFPLVFVPGALLWNPPIIDDTLRAQAMEQFFFLPKLVVLCVFGLLALLEARKQSWRHVWVGLLVAYLVLVILSAGSAQDTLTYVLLGGQQRLDGVLYQVALALIGIFAHQTFVRDPAGIPKVIAAFVAAGMVQSVLVVIQQLGFDPVATFVRWQAFGAPGGSIGHPGMVAGLLLPALVLSVWQLLELRGVRSKVWWGSTTVTLAVGLSVVSNRTALIALGVALAFVVLRRRSLETLAVVGMVTLFVVFVRDAIPSPKGPNRDLVSTQTLETRRMIWPLALQASRETRGQPFIGGGPDAFRLWTLRSVPLGQFVPLLGLELGWPSDAIIEGAEVVRPPDGPVRDSLLRVRFARFGDRKNVTQDFPITLDRAHNLVLDRLVAYGGLSALIWLVLYLYPLLKPVWDGLVRLRTDGLPRSRESDPTGVLSGGLMAAVLGLSVYYLAWFPVMQVEPLHLILLAAAWVAVSSRSGVRT